MGVGLGRNVPRLAGAVAEAVPGDDGQVIGCAREVERFPQLKGHGGLGLTCAG